MEELITNMVNNVQMENDEVVHLDIILSGGAFNAIYLVGCLYFLREMECKNKIMIHRISTCSASSFVALFYLTNNLKLFETKVYNMIVNNFKSNKKYIFSAERIASDVMNLGQLTPELQIRRNRRSKYTISLSKSCPTPWKESGIYNDMCLA